MSLLISGRMTLGPTKHEEVAIYTVNQRIPNVCRIARAVSSVAIRRYHWAAVKAVEAVDAVSSVAIRRYHWGQNTFCPQHHDIDSILSLRKDQRSHPKLLPSVRVSPYS